MAPQPVLAGSIDDLWSYLISIDWEEPWLWGLIGFHGLCTLLTVLTVGLHKNNPQIVLFFTFILLAYCAEYINEWAALHYSKFARQQYFDDKGLFISLLFSTPLLINCFVIVVYWVGSSIQTMIKLKRAKIRQEMKLEKQQQKQKDK